MCGTEGKGKGHKGNDRNNMKMAMHEELRGLNPKNQGENICFNFNLGKCDAVRPGERCSRGWHRCMAWGCASTRHGFKVSGGGHRQ